jgi:probable rRNA maturation factor
VDPDSSRLHIAVTDGRGRPVRAPGLGRWLVAVAPARARGTLAIALATNAEVRALNRRYRRKDEPTDVLSFPAEDWLQAPGKKASGRSPKPEARSLLGDLVIATGVARRQATAAGHSYATELKVLALHGLLHLLGYDHHAPDDRGRMSRLEARLRREGGLQAGLIERAETLHARHRSRPSPSQKRLRPARGPGVPNAAAASGTPRASAGPPRK